MTAGDIAWIDSHTILAIHDMQIAEHGGPAGVRDMALLQSALARPQQHAAYADPDMAELAALYALGIIRNHPFIDGNKRTGFVAFELFLAKNGYRCTADDRQAAECFLKLAANYMTDAEFFDWAHQHVSVTTEMPGP